MNITGSVHCFFEQSGTFKNEFRKLGIKAFDYDIQNEFGETDFVIDLFDEIDRAFDDKKSIFDNICRDDLIFAFFPCIYFCESSQCAFKSWHYNYRKMSTKQLYQKIIKRINNRAMFFSVFNKMFCVAKTRGIRMIVENPYSEIGYLHDNFDAPTIIDLDRQKRGDFYKKPTAFWFVNAKPTYGESFCLPKRKLTIRKSKGSKTSGVCSEERSLISPDYARNFICDFVLGKEQSFGQSTFNF